MFVRRGLPLRWRIAVLTTLAIAILSIIASVTAYLVVRSSLFGDLQRRLRGDITRVVEVYNRAGPSDLQAVLSTGGIIIQIYNPDGSLLTASGTVFSNPETASIPRTFILPRSDETGADVTDAIRNWRGTLANRPVQAAINKVSFGYIAVLAQTNFIADALRGLARSLFVTALLLIALSGVVGYFVALTSMRPLSQLARLAARLGPENLEPIGYEGPKDEVGQLANVLNDLILRLSASMDAQRSFLAETSHELRTPLTSLQGFLERASRRAQDTVQRDLEDAKRISQTMSRLVADLLQLSRGELVREMVPHLLDPYLDILEPIAEEFPGVKLSGVPGETLVGDPERLRQLIRNLVTNAIRAAGDPSKVTLMLKQTRERLYLEVRDEGPGIPKDVQSRIFDKFYKGPGGGAGLGLAIAQQIAEAHGGKLELESDEGRGAVFRLTLSTVEAEEALVQV